MILMVNFLVSFLLYDKNKNKQAKTHKQKPQSLEKKQLTKEDEFGL